MYTLRFPFRLPAGQSIEVNGEHFTIGERRYYLAKSGEWYVATIEGFGSEAEARAYLPQFWASLMWVQLHAGLAPEATLDVRQPIYSPDPHAAAANLSRGFGVKIEGPVDGLVDGSAPSIYPSEKKIRTLTAGDCGYRDHASRTRRAAAAGIRTVSTAGRDPQ